MRADSSSRVSVSGELRNGSEGYRFPSLVLLRITLFPSTIETMTVEQFQKLPVGTRVIWNRMGACHGDEGQIVLYRGLKYIQWDDGTTLGITGFAREMRWVKRAR